MPRLTSTPLVALISMTLGLAACSSNSPTPNPSASDPQPSETAKVSEVTTESEASEASSSPSADTTAATLTSDDSPIEKDFTRFSLPQDRYLKHDYFLRLKAEKTLTEPCLLNSGVDFTFPELKWTPEKGEESKNSINHFPFLTVEKAKTYGYRENYHMPELEGYLTELSNGLRSLSKDQQSIYGQCSNAIFDKHQELKPTDPELYEALGLPRPLTTSDQDPTYQRAYSILKNEPVPKLTNAINDWRQCMKPSGIDVTQYIPSDMPPNELATRWFTTESITSKLGKPFPEEVTLAVKDAECRESTQYNQVLYDALWDVTEKLVTDHEQAYKDNQASIKEKEAKLKTLIGAD